MTSTVPLSSVPAPSPPATTPTTTTSPPAAWSLARRFAFRYVCAFVILYPIGALRMVAPGGNAYLKVLHSIVSWLGQLMLGDTLVRPTPGNVTDTAINFAQLGFVLTVSFIVATAWSLIDRRRTQYVMAHDLLRVYVRYLVAIDMLLYGLVKVIKVQFPFPSGAQLIQPLGEFSPMGLMWSFMGYSQAYNVFTGSAEVLGGLLLFFRRTTTLGALIIFGVMSNVVALNFLYDVPVKLNSTLLLLFTLFLLAPDLRRLADVLVFNRVAQPAVLVTPFIFPSRVVWGLRALKLLVIGLALYGSINKAWGDYMTPGLGEGARYPLAGLYEVESFSRDGEVRPPLLGDSHRWRYFAVSHRGTMTVRTMDDASKRFRGTVDLEAKSLTLVEPSEKDAKKTVFSFTQPDPEHLVVHGTFEGANLDVRLRKVDTSKFLLLNRGFTLVQHEPFNR